jgi:hypothetical protein
MVPRTSVLLALVDLIDVIPMASGAARGGRPPVYSERLFLTALVIMRVRHISTISGLIAVLEQPTWEMAAPRTRVVEHGRFHCSAADRLLVATRRGRYPHTDDGVEVRRVFHRPRPLAIENFNGRFKGIFGAHVSVPARGLVRTRHFALGAVFLYQSPCCTAPTTGRISASASKPSRRPRAREAMNYDRAAPGPPKEITTIVAAGGGPERQPARTEPSAVNGSHATAEADGS